MVEKGERKFEIVYMNFATTQKTVECRMPPGQLHRNRHRLTSCMNYTTNTSHAKMYISGFHGAFEKGSSRGSLDVCRA